MSYTKIYYDDIWTATHQGKTKCNEWLTELGTLSSSLDSFNKTDGFKGEAATNMKNYLNQVHGVLISVMGTVMESYGVLAGDYYNGYRHDVDSGDARFTTIVKAEVSETGSIQKELNKILKIAEKVASDANSVKSSIVDLVTITSSPKLENLTEKINAAIKDAQDVHDRATTYEASRVNDFNDIDTLIEQAKSIISKQLSDARIPVVAYQSGSIGKMCDMDKIKLALEANKDKITTIQSDESYEEDVDFFDNRVGYLQESRQWAKWVAVGIVAAGSIALMIVTAGGATPLVCASVGAIAGGVGTGATLLADEYVEKGNLREMDWSNFGRDVAIATVGGFIAGGLGAVSHGSAIKQPIKKAIQAVSHTAIQEVSEGVTAVVWETGETAFEVGHAWVSGKPGKEVSSVLADGMKETEEQFIKHAKEATIKSAKSFTTSYISGYFDADTSDKGLFRKIGEKTVEEVAGGVSENAVDTAWKIRDAITDDDVNTTAGTAFKDGLKNTGKGVVADAVSGVASSAISEGFSGVDDIDNSVVKATVKTVTDTAASTVEKVTEGVTGRAIDHYVYGDETDGSRIFGDIWEKDLEGGTAIVEDAADAAGNNFAEEFVKDKGDLRKLDRADGKDDGKAEFIEFGDRSVSKQDYDAAIENAGKGVYKDKTAQDILGLPHDTDLSSGKQRTVPIRTTYMQFDDKVVTKQEYDSAVENAGKGEYKDKTVQDILGLPKDTDLSSGKEHKVSSELTKKYSSDRKTTDTVTVDGKYTYTESYYESAINAAGKGDYKDKTANDILGLPKDYDLSEAEITHKRVRNDDIGTGKDVELHRKSGTQATHYDVPTERQIKMEINKQKKEIAKKNKK